MVVDDHPLVRRGIVESLSDDAAFHVAGEGGDTDAAVALSASLQPHLIFLDVNMPGGGGVVAAARIHAEMPHIKIAMFSFRQDLAIVRASLAAGASGYVVKGVSGSELITIAHRILGGEIVLCPEIAKRLALDDLS
ncbi:MAG: response regulator transcription factor [Sphingomonas sp.]